MARDMERPRGARQPADPDVSAFAGQLFFRLWRASHTRTADALAPMGLTPARFAVLNLLGARDGVIQQQLSAEMGMDPSAMVKLINELEETGLADRRRRPNDRRAWEVSITGKGRRALDRARELASHVENDILGGLAQRERDDLIALLRKALAASPPQPAWRAEEGD